jgi:Protein of unknown function (DUF2806)
MADVKITLLPESFGPAAEKLAGTVQHVVEFVAGPERVRARAQAHADAEAYAIVTKAEADARAKGLESRAFVRLKKRETRRQNNIEQITEKAVLHLPPPEQVSDERVNEDWTSRFFEECQDISDAQMQQIWAKILAGEVARPGSFSPRTLTVVRDLTTKDAILFARLCSFIWHLPGWFHPTPIIMNFQASEVVEAGLYFSNLVHLKSIGLVEFSPSPMYLVQPARTEFSPSYFGKVHQLRCTTGEQQPLIGCTVFTAVGIELVNTLEPVQNERYERLALDCWHQHGWIEAPSAVETDVGPT